MIPTDLEITLEFLDSPTEVDFFAVAGAPGHDGADGAPGRDGADGHTPVITASKQGNTTTISVDGNPVAQILDGATGAKGDKGDPGQDGAKGDKGDTGAKGDKGDKGDTGAQGIQGIQGEKGETGAKGDKGDKGDTGATGAAGQDGHTPVKGTDYWTAEDKAEIVEDVTEEIDIPAVASGAQVKGGSASSVFIAPSVEDAASFYGLAKAAGDSTQSASSNAVGTYTDDAKVKIQKMLGIYEAPWELIREDTFTNETEADHIITVDSNGQAFDLTDVMILFATPQQSTYSAKGYYGHIWFYRTNYPSQYLSIEPGSWTQQADSAGHTIMGRITNEKGGLVTVEFLASSASGARNSIQARLFPSLPQNVFSGNGFFMFPGLSFNKVNIKAVTGTGHYVLYGKRKWQ